MTESDKPRKRTPRVPSTVLYDRVVPIALALMALALLVVIVVAVIGMTNAVR